MSKPTQATPFECNTVFDSCAIAKNIREDAERLKQDNALHSAHRALLTAPQTSAEDTQM